MKRVKTLSLLLALCMIFSLVMPVSAFADEDLTPAETPVVEVPAEDTPVDNTPVVEPPVEDTPVDDDPAGDESGDAAPAGDDPGDFSLPKETEENEEEEAELTPEDIYALIPVLYSGGSSSDTFYKIVHVDCGRKYFSPENIKKIIDNAAAAGFNQVELYLSDNQGFRFALNDMNVTTSTGNTYDLTPALGDGYSDGSKYPDGSGKYLTQSEMTDIISYASGKGIDIVPCINVPGHMGAILEEFTEFKYSGSNSSIDLENTEAVAFALAITEKYATYFESQGVKYYNLGADEYANDLSTMGFQGLHTSGKYVKFVNFLNAAAQVVINHNMTPRAFNDGIYYNEDNTYPINSAIQVCYWSCGWNGYNLASAQYIVNQGMNVINTHGDYYWVLGNTSWQCSADKASQFDYTSFQYRTGTTGNGTISDPAGAMFCIWCDVGNANGTDGGTAVVSATADVIAAFGAVLPASESGDNGGETAITIQKDGNDVSTFSVKMGGTATLSLSDSEATATWSSSDENVATVTAVTRSVEANSVTVNPVSEGTATITATLSDGTALTTQVTVAAAGTSEEPDWNKKIVLEVGDTTQENQENVNNKENVDRTILDDNIATVEVTGTDKTEDTTVYTQASVNCNTLISSDTNNWTATSGYYYTPDGINYYPVYAKRSSSGWLFKSYSYTWGYSTTSSTSNVTQITTQSTYDASTTPNITVYTKSTADGSPASTTITFTGVTPGTTYVKVGDITYKIIVNYKQETINATVDQETYVTVSGELDSTKLDTSIALVSVENGTMTVTGVSEGTTQVTVGNTIYTIEVTKEDLSLVTPLEVEYWITNQKVSANSANSMTIAATVDGVHSENGVLFSSLVPEEGRQGGNTMVFWKGTVQNYDATDSANEHDYGHQNIASGNDRTLLGHDFSYIRYWNGAWAYSSDGVTWTDIDLSYNSSTANTKNDQVVAYYLQKTDVTDEVTTYVVDWGPKKANWSDLNYLGTKYVLLDYSVKYESGDEYPSSFPTANSLSFHCDTSTRSNGYYYRTLGMVRAGETDEFEVYMITVTPSDDSPANTLASTAASNTSYSYNGTEVVAWAATEEDLNNSGLGTYTSISGAYSCSIGGDPVVSGLEIYRQQGLKVTFYIRAKVTEDSLAVHYVDKIANQEFYSYNIAVKTGTLFDANIGLASPDWKTNLDNGTVTNILGKSQTVSADLSTMPAIGAQYRYSEYTCEEVVRSEDGKEIYLYYTFNNAHSFVIDFGLPLKITTSDLGISGDWTSASVSGAQYGTATATVGAGVTYTPNKTLKGVETLQLTLTDSTGSVTHQIYIYPATTVFYEESFAVAEASTVSTLQTTQVAGKSSDEYGYDAAYSGSVCSSAALTNAGFSFTGTGVDIYTNNTTADAWMMVVIKSGDTIVKAAQVNTAMKNGTTDATQNQAVDGYGVPVYSIDSLRYGSYTVTLTRVSGETVRLDGFRVYNTLSTEPDFYKNDAEDAPVFIELRDRVLASLSAKAENSSQYAAQISRNTLSQVYATAGTTGGVVITAKPGTYTDTDEKLQDELLQDLLDNGPKNEIYLQPGQAMTFKINTNREVQLGLRALNAATSYSINNGDSVNISSNTDMFYPVLAHVTDSAEQTVTISNTGSSILAVTKLKVCDDPNFSFVELTDEDLVPALLSLGYELEPEEPEVQYADAVLTVEVNGQTTVLTKNGVVGESATFTAAEIEAAAQTLVPEGYELKDQAADVTVAYGGSSTVSLRAEEIPTEPEQPEEPEQPTEPEKPEQPSKPANIVSAVIRLIDRIFGSLKGLFR